MKITLRIWRGRGLLPGKSEWTGSSHVPTDLAIGLDAVEEDSGALPGLGSEVVPCTLGEAVVIPPTGCGDVGKDGLPALLCIGKVGQDGRIAVAAIGRPLLVEEIVPMRIILR